MSSHEDEPFLYFVDNPPVYLTVMHLSCLYSIPVFFTAAYCIIYASPSQMGNFKWVQLYHVSCSFLLEIALTLCLTPVLYLTVPGGSSNGFGTHIMESLLTANVSEQLKINICNDVRCHLDMEQANLGKIQD
ncbi:hypothetical protein ANCCAN_00970 [Ancylostoma caninum]|uniref:Uncharacterized protein n=1 Tax=Ancylostoma caninum TaxID=29170 RepID=A0A368H8T0_ANCCA|nr:hypothetical protein ANCCAN_00970 [Ancylostoma caninum]